MTVQKRTTRGVVIHDRSDQEQRYVATQRLCWGGDWIEPGQEIPLNREGRSMAGLLRQGAIAPYVPLDGEPGR